MMTADEVGVESCKESRTEQDSESQNDSWLLPSLLPPSSAPLSLKGEAFHAAVIDRQDESSQPFREKML